MNARFHLSILLVCSFLIFGFFFLCPVSAAGSSVIVQSYEVIPPVLMPLEKGTVTVQIKNAGTSSETNSHVVGDSTSSTTTELIPHISSVTLQSKDLKVISDGSQFEGDLGPGQVIPVTFLVEAPQASGLYFPEVWVRIKDSPSVKYALPVNVNTQLSVLKTPTLNLDAKFPDMVLPGSKILGTITISNNGKSGADNIQVFINGTAPTVIPTGIHSFQIEHLDSGDSRIFNVSLLVDKNAQSGLFDVPVGIHYSLLDGTPVGILASIGLNIRGQAELGITSIETTPVRVTEGDPLDLIIRIQNTGTGDAKMVSVALDLPFKWTKEAFIGKMKQGNYAPALFNFQNQKAGEYQYNATIKYLDDWGEHTLMKNLSITVSGNDGTGVVIAGTIIIIVIALLIYQFWWKRRGQS